jgi:DNA-binding NarL/FixJ family response regulator
MSPLYAGGLPAFGNEWLQVFTAASGEEALKVYRERGQNLDLVIMDLGMPGMGGQKAFEQIIELNPRVKVIIASGYAADDTMHEILRSTVAGYIPKPFRKDELLAKVREVLDRPV